MLLASPLGEEFLRRKIRRLGVIISKPRGPHAKRSCPCGQCRTWRRHSLTPVAYMQIETRLRLEWRKIVAAEEEVERMERRTDVKKGIYIHEYS